jgi:hypothetical protein
MQSPNIVGMLGATLHVSAQAQIIAINLFGLFSMSLIEKQRSEGMARGVHPGPRLCVGEIVVKVDCLAQVLIGFLMATLMIGQLAV